MLSEKNNALIPNLIKDSKTQPICDYKECLFEKVFVETTVDTDADGKCDLIAVYIRRPKETLDGFKVPAIYVANPYMMMCNDELYKTYSVDKNISEYETQNIAEADIAYDFEGRETGLCQFLGRDTSKIEHYRETKGFASTAETKEIPLDCISDWYSYFNSRGYASVFCGGLGTRGSEGITVTGSREEIWAFQAVIDWLNGRCRAFTNRTDNIEIRADWCSGNVAMSGKSYLGTLCIGVATTGVEGLKTIIPEAAISNWYAYDRYNGLNVPPLGWQGDDVSLLSQYCCSRLMDEADKQQIGSLYEGVIRKMEEAQDRASGNYNKFWDERNYLKQVDKIKASVFIVHGLNDWNVKMNQCIPLWNELEKRDITRRMLLHQGDHIYVHNLEGCGFNEILHQWLDCMLYEIDNGVTDKPAEVRVQSNLDQNKWLVSPNWGEVLGQARNFNVERCQCVNKCQKKEFIDDLTKLGFDREKDNLKEWRENLVMGNVLDGQNKSEYRLRYLWHQSEALRICGRARVSFEAELNKGTGILSVMLVDFGESCRLLEEQVVVSKSGLLWGKNTPTADWVRFKEEEQPSEYKIITRGWVNVQNRRHIFSKEAIKIDEFDRYDIEMVPMDYMVPKGHSLGLIIYGTDAEATERPLEVTLITIEEDSIALTIPTARQM